MKRHFQVAAGAGAPCPSGSNAYMARYVHKISPSPKDVEGPFCINDNAFSNRNTLGAALRKAKLLTSGGRIGDFRVEGDRVIVFPMASIWHSIILTQASGDMPDVRGVDYPGFSTRERGGRRVAADRPEIEEIGHIGDVNWAEYGGGPVYRRLPASGDQTDIYGDCFLEYIEPPEDGVEFNDPRARWTIYRIDLDPELPNWGDVKSAAQTSGQDPKELAAAFASTNPMERAWAYETWAGNYGWYEFDQYPLTLTCAEMNERYDAGIDCDPEEDLDEPRRVSESSGRYRINYGNGQVSRSFGTSQEAQRELAALDRYSEYAFLERYEAGSADEPGGWFTYKPKNTRRN